MGNSIKRYIIYFLLVFENLLAKSVTKNRDDILTYEYSLKSDVLHSKYMSYSNLDQLLPRFRFQELKSFAKQYWMESKKLTVKHTQQSFSINLNNFLQHFASSKCLIELNNYLSIDIESLETFPFMIKKLELVSFQLFSKDYNSTDLIWTPKEVLHYINGNFSIKNTNENNFFARQYCELSKYYVSLKLRPGTKSYCVELEPFHFS